MNLVNATGMIAAYNLGLDADGGERVLAVVKGTFTIPQRGQQPALAAEQVPLIEADAFFGEPGKSATRYETDYAPFKPQCDVLLNGSAYAPRGIPARSVQVRLRMGTIDKAFEVVGDRVWEGDRFGAWPTEPAPFDQLAIHYGRAFGGFDVSPDDPARGETFLANPIGCGFHPVNSGWDIAGKPAPNTQEWGVPVADPKRAYRAMSFGPIGRNFSERIPFAGTYDDRWMNERAPLLPADFDPRYYQCAPTDQQMPYPTGGEVVELFGLTPEGHTSFALPPIELPIEFTDADYKRNEVPAVVDTIMIEPDLQRFTMCWRASQPLKRNLLEIRQIVVGRMPRGWYRARALGKDYFPSLSSAIASKGNGLVQISE